uniref:Uncharacterized protein n=1 Tax=Corvus moneduloides TaxID=1196302 RepID=A0A8C3D2M7_CORMO
KLFKAFRIQNMNTNQGNYQLNWKGTHKRNSLCKNKLFLFLSQILANSQTLLDVLKEEMGDLGRAIEPQSTSLGQRVRQQKHC